MPSSYELGHTGTLAMPHPEGHDMTGYSVGITGTCDTRWGEVRCTCGAAHRLTWGEGVQTYMQLLTTAWLQMGHVDVKAAAVAPVPL